MPECATQPFQANGRTYTPPNRPVAVICLDGSSDEYFDAAMTRGRMPELQRLCVQGHRGLARGALPSFTNVNNASIVTGVPPSVHGIGGNFFYDPQSDREVMMNSASYLRAETILAAAARAGRKVATVTAKDKLREILAHGLQGISFSAEKAGEAKVVTHGIDQVEALVGASSPPIYSAEASLYVLRAGVALLQKGLADFLYLSTTDYLQHKCAPEEPEALEFYAGLDGLIGALSQAGAVLGITADHGMNAKHKLDGQPQVLFLEDQLEEQFGAGGRVILPITDPYVRHHGALGSFAVVHLPADASRKAVHAWLLEQPGITEVHDRETAAVKLQLPADRIGDLVVLAGRDWVIGRRPEYHDLSALVGELRSHGGRYEEMVPLVITRPLSDHYRRLAAGDPRNFDVFDFTLNGAQA